MTTREKLINQFIEELGPGIIEECEKQKGNDFFLEQIWSDNMTDEVYQLTEDGQHLVLMSEEDARKFKKSLKKEEIHNKIGYDKIKHYIRPFQVIQAYFPYTNKPNQYSIRPILVVPVNKTEYRFMMITTGAYTDIIYRRYEVSIQDWKDAGLHHLSYVRANIFEDYSGLIFFSNFKIYGSLSDQDIIQIMRLRKKYVNETFTNPIAFMYWLITNKISDTIAIDSSGNNNINPIQSIYDIEESKHANCVDIAIATYKMCNNHREFKPSTIGTVSWIINDHRSDGHVFTLFKYKRNTYIFDYDQINTVGSFPNYKSESFEDAAFSFCCNIKKDHPNKEVRSLSLKKQFVYVLDEKDLNNAEDTSKYSNQIEWLQDYSALYQINKQRSLIQGKFYRVSYNGEGIYEVLRKKVGWDWKTVKQDPDINWLPTPEVDEYKDTYRSYFTTLGYKTFQAKTMKVIDKYLDPKKIKVREYNDIHGILMYKDQYQVVVDQGDEVMNEKFGITTMNDLVAFRRDFSEYIENKMTSNPEDIINEEAEYGNNWFISEDDIYLNWDKWEDGSAHLVFVNGLSGSGKSTLGRKISENYDAYYVELDVYGWGIVGQIAVEKNRTNYEYIKEKDRKLYEYMKSKRIPPDIFAKIDKWNYNAEEHEFKVREIEKYLYWLAFEQDEKVVVEGGYTGVVMVRNPELWKDTPIIFKGTSVTKSIFRRMIRATKKNGPIEIVTVIKAFKPQYLDHMIPETNASRKAMLSGRDNWEYVKESFTQIEADKSPHTKKKKLDLRKIPTKIADFKDFLRKIKTPEMVMKWFLKVKLRWTPHGGSNDHPFQWPDWLIKQRMGNCFDQSIFLHYFCRAKRIDHKMYLVTWLADNGQGTGHAVPLYKKGDKVYVFAYLNPKIGFIGGPFRSYGEAKKVLDNYFLMHINQFFKAPSTPYSSYLSDDDLANFDKYYNNRKITQTEYIIEGLGKNMRSSHLFKIKVKGFAFPNPILPAYDCIVTVFRAISTIYNFFTVNEEVDIDYENEDEVITEEDQLTEDDWIHDPSLMYRRSNKRKFDKIKNFDQFCREIDTPQEALSYFIIEKVRWSSMEEMSSKKRPFYWPDDIIRGKIGVCFDQTIFMHQFYDRKSIENKSGLMYWQNEDNKSGGSHIVPMFKQDNGYFCAVYLPNIGWIQGPYNSWEECLEETGKTLSRCSDLTFGGKYKWHVITEITPDEWMRDLDKFSKSRRNITFYEFMTKDGCRRLRNTKTLNFKYKNLSIWNPIVSVWNIIRFLRNNFDLDIPYYGFEESALLEEKLSADERRCFGLPKKKKYPMPDEAHVRAAIRFFNHCDPEDEEELARNIKKYMKKYNMKDVNVSDNNRFKKYYHPEESKEEKKPIKEETKSKITDKVISINNEAYDAYLYIRSCVNGARRSLSMLETSAAMGGPVVGMEINDQTVHYSNPGMFIIQYSDGNDTGYGITNDLKTKYFLRHDKKKNKLVKEDYSEFLKDKYFGIYSITQEHRDLWNNLLTSFYEDPKYLYEGVRTLSLYEYFSGRRELVGDQIDYDENFNRVDPLWLDLMYNMKLQNPNKLNIPVINENYNGGDFRKHITLPQGIREFVSSSLHSNELVLCEDPKGMYLLDENNNLVSRYITQEELEILNEVI